MSLVDLSKKELLPAEHAANGIDRVIDSALSSQVRTVKYVYDAIWINDTATPQKVFDAFGNKAKKMWKLYLEQTGSLDKSLSVLNIPRTELLNDLYFMTPVPITMNSDGTVTVMTQE